jgi:hypothetical protein
MTACRCLVISALDWIMKQVRKVKLLFIEFLAARR